MLTRPFKARTVTEKMRDRYRSERVEEAKRKLDFDDLPPELRGQMREIMDYDGALRYAESHPVYGHISVIDDLRTTWTGGVWVRRTPEDGYPWEDHVIGNVFGLAFSTASAPASPIDVISAGGRYVGTFPPRSGVRHVRGFRAGRAGRLRREERVRCAHGGGQTRAARGKVKNLSRGGLWGSEDNQRRLAFGGKTGGAMKGTGGKVGERFSPVLGESARKTTS